MSYSPRTILVGAAVSFALTTLARAGDTGSLGIGHVATPAQIAGWDIDVRADGQGLPPGLVIAGQEEAAFQKKIQGGLQIGDFGALHAQAQGKGDGIHGWTPVSK